MPTFLTQGRHGYSVRFSRTRPDALAVATSQYYGLAGGGTLFFLELTPDGSTLLEVQKLEWSDGLFDVTWSGTSDNTAACGAGDGAVIVWRVGCSAPLRVLRAHTSEVCSVDWPRSHLLSASWDTTVKLVIYTASGGNLCLHLTGHCSAWDNVLDGVGAQHLYHPLSLVSHIHRKDKWDPDSETCLSTFAGHSQLVYTAAFSPHSPATFASVSGDGHLKLWTCTESGRPAAVVKAHDAEVLSCDWSRTETHAIATAGSDGLVKGWDLRRLTSPMFTLKGCECAVRRVQFSPHAPSVIAAVSYDFTTRIWDLKRGCDPLETIRHHSEFTYGLDWNSLRPHQIADCGWDSLVHVFMPRSLACV